MTQTEMERLIERYSIQVVDGDKLKMYPPKEKDLMILKANKAAIIQYIEEKEEAERRAYQIRQAKIKAIEGLEEIKRAYSDLNAWQREFNTNIDKGYSGVGLRPYPQYDIEGMLAKYPQAAAYLTAEREAERVNPELALIGKKALDRVIDGDYEQAIIDMKEDLSEFAERHLWD